MPTVVTVTVSLELSSVLFRVAPQLKAPVQMALILGAVVFHRERAARNRCRRVECHCRSLRPVRVYARAVGQGLDT